MATINRVSNQSGKSSPFIEEVFLSVKLWIFYTEGAVLFEQVCRFLSDRYMSKGRVKEKMSRSICGTKKAIFKCYDEFQ